MPVLFDANVTVSPEVAVALIENGAVPNDCPLSVPKVMVCEPCVTLNVCVTGVAAA